MSSALLNCATVKGCLAISLSLSYPKKDWWVGPCQSFFGYDTDYRSVFCCLHRLYSVVSVITKEGLVGPGRSILLGHHQSFFWCDNDKDLNACFPVTQLSFYGQRTDMTPECYSLLSTYLDSAQIDCHYCVLQVYVISSFCANFILKEIKEHGWLAL